MCHIRSTGPVNNRTRTGGATEAGPSRNSQTCRPRISRRESNREAVQYKSTRPESGPLKAVHLSRHKWPGICCPFTHLLPLELVPQKRQPPIALMVKFDGQSLAPPGRTPGRVLRRHPLHLQVISPELSTGYEYQAPWARPPPPSFTATRARRDTTSPA